MRDRVTKGLGERLLSNRISLKPYPCGRNLHGWLDATSRARAAHAGRTVERIDVHVDARSFARATLTWPEHVVAARFSIPFAVALSAATGRTSLAHFDAPNHVPDAVKTLFRNVHVQSHAGTPEEDRIVFHYTNGGTHAEITAGVRLGNPANPVSREQTAEKLRDCNAFAGSPLPEPSVERLLSAALGLRASPPRVRSRACSAVDFKARCGPR